MTRVELSINYAPATIDAPESVFGTVRHTDGSQTPFGGWLALLTILQTAAAANPDSKLGPTRHE